MALTSQYYLTNHVTTGDSISHPNVPSQNSFGCSPIPQGQGISLIDHARQAI